MTLNMLGLWVATIKETGPDGGQMCVYTLQLMLVSVDNTGSNIVGTAIYDAIQGKPSRCCYSRLSLNTRTNDSITLEANPMKNSVGDCIVAEITLRYDQTPGELIYNHSVSDSGTIRTVKETPIYRVFPGK